MVPLDPPTPGQHLLSALVDLPSGKVSRRASTRIQLACTLFGSLVRGSEKAKGVARMVVPGESKVDKHSILFGFALIHCI